MDGLYWTRGAPAGKQPLLKEKLVWQLFRNWARCVRIRRPITPPVLRREGERKKEKPQLADNSRGGGGGWV